MDVMLHIGQISGFVQTMHKDVAFSVFIFIKEHFLILFASVCVCAVYTHIYVDDGDGAACWSDVIFLFSFHFRNIHSLPRFEEFMRLCNVT